MPMVVEECPSTGSGRVAPVRTGATPTQGGATCAVSLSKGNRRHPRAHYVALLLADARLPTGAHTQSAGLEPALRNGMRADQVPDYLRARLQTVTEVEAAAAVVARHRWLSVLPTKRAAALAEVDRAWRVRTWSDAIRAASDQLGRGYLRTTSALWDLGLDPRGRHSRAEVVGAVGAAAGLDATATARLIGYDDVQTVVAATLKLAPFDPVLATRWVLAAGPLVDQMAARVAGFTTVEEIPAYAAHR